MIGPRPVVVTGASSGIGAACVKVLAQEGLTPIPMVRKDRDLDDLATQIGFVHLVLWLTLRTVRRCWQLRIC